MDGEGWVFYSSPLTLCLPVTSSGQSVERGFIETEIRHSCSDCTVKLCNFSIIAKSQQLNYSVTLKTRV